MRSVKLLSIFVAGVLTLTGCTGVASPGVVEAPTPAFAYEDIAPAIATKYIGAECKSLKKTMTSSKDISFANKHMKSLSAIYRTSNARRAANYADKNDWVWGYEDVSSSWSSQVQAQVSNNFNKLMNNEYPNETVPADGESKFWSDTLKQCKLAKTFNTSVTTLQNFASAAQMLTSEAELAPWYPEGYNEWGSDSSIAWKWDHSTDCSYYTAVCWHVKVLLDESCGSLYGEINIEDGSGTVIDYTNDLTGSLGSGDSAILEFVTFNDYASSATLTDLTCNTY